MANTLLYQHSAEGVTELRYRIAAALMRHAAYLVTKVSPTANEVAWRNEVLGNGYPSMLDRAVRYVAAKPVVYESPNFSEAELTDAELLAIVPELPDALVTV